MMATDDYSTSDHQKHQRDKEKNIDVEKAPTLPITGLVTYRWLILTLFCLLSMTNSFQWIEYATIGHVVTRYYNVSYSTIDWMSMIYMICYIPLILPAGWVMDRYGLRLVVILGAFGNCLGSWVKCASSAPNRLAIGFVGQVIVGSSQIFILCVPPRLAAVWFGPNEVSLATSIGVFGNQLGIALGFWLPTIVVHDSRSPDVIYSQLQMLFFLTAATTFGVFVLILAAFKDAPPYPPSVAQCIAITTHSQCGFCESLKQLKTLNFSLLLLTYGLNVGTFYSISTLLNQSLFPFYPTEAVNIGRIGSLIVIAGMFGSVTCGFWLSRTQKFKLTLCLVYTLSFCGMLLYTLTVGNCSILVIFFVAGLLGFFMTGYLPLGFEYAAEITYPVSEDIASSFLNGSAQVFGIMMTFGMGYMLQRVSVLACNITLTVLLAVGSVLTDTEREEVQF